MILALLPLAEAGVRHRCVLAAAPGKVLCTAADVQQGDAAQGAQVESLAFFLPLEVPEAGAYNLADDLGVIPLSGSSWVR